MRSYLKVGFALLVLTLATAAFADSVSFTFSMGGNVGSALLNTTVLGGGQFLVTGGTLDVTAGADTGTYSVIPGGPVRSYHRADGCSADNVLSPPPLTQFRRQ